jgi:hypothetical protein
LRNLRIEKNGQTTQQLLLRFLKMAGLVFWATLISPCCDSIISSSRVLILHRRHTGLKQLNITMRRAGDVQIVDMAMRRLQANFNDAERLEVSLKALAVEQMSSSMPDEKQSREL